MLAFLQKIGKSLMFPIATLPAAAILVRFGSDDMLGNIDIAWVQYVAAIMVAAGNAILGNLPIIFAVGIAMGLAVDGAGAAALAGLIAQLVLVAVLGSVNDKLDMGVFGGVISGVTAGLLYNKFRNIQFPEWLSFFGGRRFVPIITSIVMAILGAILGVLWGYPQALLDSAANWMIGAGPLGAGIYGFLNRLLIPTGLHHVINTVVWFDFGTFKTAAGELVKGDIPRFLAGDPTAGHFQAGFFPIMMFGLPAACLAMFLAAEKKRRPLVAGMFLSIGITAFLTGVTEPIEFSFMFLSPILYGIHAVLTGISLAVAYIVGFRDGFGFSASFIDYLLNLGLAEKPWLLLPLGLAFGALYFVIFYFLIRKLDLKTPGREDEEEEADMVGMSGDEVLEAKAYHTIEGLGGVDNIQQVDYCTTRLRMTLKDSEKVDEKELKKYGARGVMKISKTNVQVIIGTSVEFLAEAIKNRIKAGNPPLKDESIEITALKEDAPTENEAFIPGDFEMPITGKLLPLADIPDQAFASGAMGPGFGIDIQDGVIQSPVDGKVVMVFPTKHAIGIQADNGMEILIHVGLDTVKLNGEGFEIFVEANQFIQRGDKLMNVDIEAIRSQVPSLVTPVVFTNSQGKEVTLKKSGYQEAGTASIIDVK
ncbi:N-acetylglucosamine-specific PTS transporter subunit IIBC [Kurthia gibsonii]|uniref:N-acetylglucosamine-specific PTS transporter subunit IIBC n=1 Tax=Kurthia gibsonii TaxID=33946 RepID=UPI0030D2AABE